MSGLVKKPQAHAKAWAPPSEVTVWLSVIAMVGILNVFFSVRDFRAGRNLVAMTSGRVAVSFGVLLGWGGVHAVSRHHEDVFWFMGMGGLLGDGGRQRPLLASFALSLVLSLVVCPFGAVFMSHMRRARARRFPITKPPQADHLLHDADVDASAGGDG